MPSSTRIEICGGIGSGKTSLARLLAEIGGLVTVFEEPEKNPFWGAFYRDSQSLVYEKDVWFLTQHCAEIKLADKSKRIVCDFALVQELAYASLAQDPRHNFAIRTLFDHLYRSLPPPNLIVHLQCAEQVQLRRIRSRGRKQEAAIDLSFLGNLNRAIEQSLCEWKALWPIIRIQTDQIDLTRHSDEAVALVRNILVHASAASPT